MARTISILLSESDYCALQAIASQKGQSPEQCAANALRQFADELSKGEVHATDSAAGQPSAQSWIDKWAGAFRSGDPHSGDNEQIDADLAKEYGRGLER